MPRKVRRGSTLEPTWSANTSSPPSRTTPAARPPDVRIRSTPAFVRISAPKLTAAFASVSATAPIPPRWKPHDRDAPSISPM